MSLDDFRDSQGFIGHKVNDQLTDFGDSAQRTFTEAICLYSDDNSQLRASILTKIFLCTYWNTEGRMQLVRHWDHNQWPGQPFIMSRDNFKPMLWALALESYADNLCLLQILNVIRGRFYFLWNYKGIWPKSDEEPKLPDLISPTTITGAYIRSKESVSILDRFFLNLCDLIDVLDVLILVIKSYFKPNDTSDDLNQMNEIFFKCLTHETIISRLQKNIYKLRRAPTEFAFYDNKFKRIIRSYYWDDSTMPPMWEVIDPMIDRYL